MKRRKHWYFITVNACVLCRRTEVWRERRYGRRPKQWRNRHEYRETACDSHFL